MTSFHVTAPTVGAGRLAAALLARGLPRPTRPEDVEAEFAAWAARGLEPSDHRCLLVDPGSLDGRVLPSRGRTLLALLALLREPPEEWPSAWTCRLLAERLGDVSRDLDPAGPVLALLEDKAARAVASACVRLVARPRGLASYLDGPVCEARDDGLLVPRFAVRLPLRDILVGLREDGRQIWRLRETVAVGRDAFDAAVTDLHATLSPGLDRALLRLFERRTEAPPGPSGFVAAFRHAARDGRWASLVLGELERRAKARDGFPAATGDADWLGALTHLDGWTPGLVRRLVHLGPATTLATGPYLAAGLRAASAVEPTDPDCAAFAVLDLLRHARQARLDGGTLLDADREGRFRAGVRALTFGEGALRIDALLAELPSGPRGTATAWPCLGAEEKDEWRRRVHLEISRVPSLAPGLVEYLLARTRRQAYVDVLPLVHQVLEQEGAHEALLDLASSPHGLTALRAGALARAASRAPGW